MVTRHILNISQYAKSTNGFLFSLTQSLKVENENNKNSRYTIKEFYDTISVPFHHTTFGKGLFIVHIQG